MNVSLARLDWFVIAAYLAVMISVGALFYQRKSGTTDFFLRTARAQGTYLLESCF
jgi:hypothetical protein